MTKEDFDAFAKYVATDEFKLMSEKAQISKSFDEHPHRMGTTSYAQNDIKWLKEGYYSSPSSSTSVGSCTTLDSLTTRAQRWILARSKKNDKGELIVPNEKTRQAKETIDIWNQKVHDGEFQPYGTDDVLNRSLNRKEHGGRLLGVGGQTTRRDVLGPSHERSHSQEKKDAEMKEYVKSLVTQQVASTVAAIHRKVQQHYDEMGAPIPSHVVEWFTGTVNSPEVDKPPSSCQSGGVDPFADLQGKYPCKLAMMLHTEKVIVAYGVADVSASIIHNKPVSPQNVVVSIDDYEANYEHLDVPVPNGGVSIIGEAVGSFVQWPKDLVEIVKDKASSPKVQSGKRKQDESGNATNESAVCVKKPFHPQKCQPPISDKCKRMKALWDGLKHDDMCTLPFRADKTVFCLSEDEDIFINDEDMNDILSGDWLGSPVIDVFIMALKHQYSKHLDSIGFMCSGSISSIACQRDRFAVSRYMTNFMQQNESKRFIFCPYWEADHWILIVISLKKREVYTFDPFRLTINDRILIRTILDGAFLAYVQLGPKRLPRSKLTWLPAKGAQQLGTKECGYFVMRYMLDMVLNHRDSENLVQDYERTESYTEEEINEVLDVWAKYCVSTIMIM